MIPGLSEGTAFDQLKSARAELDKVLPPQSDKILRALQHVELALQHYTINGLSNEVLHAIRVALRALNQIEKRSELPPMVSVAIGLATSDLANIFRAMRAGQIPTTSVPEGTDVPVEGDSRKDRRAADADSQDYAGPRRRDDDETMDGLECLNEELMLLSES